MGDSSEVIRPMLAAQKYRSRNDLWTPAHQAVVEQHLKEDGYLIVQPKYDGFRTLFYDGVGMSRAWKPHRNRYMQAFAKDFGILLNGLDGELLPGHQAREDVFRQAMSDLRAEDGTKQFTIYVYDYFLDPIRHGPYNVRLDAMQDIVEALYDNQLGDIIKGENYEAKVVLTKMWLVKTMAELEERRAQLIAEGWEGAIVRRPNLPYKYNRSTALGGELVKAKAVRQTDEAVIEGFEPWYENQNEAQTSALGFTTRTSHQENMVPLERLGAFKVRLLNKPEVRFKIGVLSGITHADRDRLWAERESYLEGIIEFSHDGYGGGYSAPRTPVGLRLRPKEEF